MPTPRAICWAPRSAPVEQPAPTPLAELICGKPDSSSVRTVRMLLDEVASQLGQLAGRPDFPDYLRPVIPALQAILSGSRDPALASDPGLDYDAAVELRLLLESLA